MWVTLLKHHMKEAPLGFVGICDSFFFLQKFSSRGPHVNHELKDCCLVIHEHGKSATVHCMLMLSTSVDFTGTTFKKRCSSIIKVRVK